MPDPERSRCDTVTYGNDPSGERPLATVTRATGSGRTVSTNRAFPYPRHGRPGGVGSDQQMVEQLVVRLDDPASPAEVDEVREILASSELAAEVRADWQK